ncbi:hypothetical protein [Streptomyces sp. NPDC004629]|uniref:hypothetical protein n=1 Tax=Streptomyces sp. NPDC004629 TaxID=3364705 RepID=UPI0036BA2F2A
MKIRTALCAALLALTALTAGCGSGDAEAGPGACKAALEEQVSKAAKNDEEGGRPAECDGLDDKTLRRLTGEVITEWLKSDEADKAAGDALKDAFGDGIPVSDLATPGAAEPTPTTATGVSAACRAWIEQTLPDPTDEGAGATGSGACGALTDDELHQAVEKIINDLAEKEVTTAP